MYSPKPRLFKIELIVRMPYYTVAKNEREARKEAAHMLKADGFNNTIELNVQEVEDALGHADWLTPREYDGEAEESGY